VATPALEFRDVSKTFRSRMSGSEVVALSGVSFDAASGEVCAFLGPNGAGKTTSINILMGFLFPDYGEVRVLGCEPGDVRAKKRIGFVPENFAFYKFMTGPRLLRFHMALAEQRENDGRLVSELLAKVKLDGYEELKIGKYSRGMVQRVGIAQALLSGPDLLVLDEPTSGLDPAGRAEVLELLAEFKAEGKTVFLSSHILPEVEQICDRVIIIDRGRLVRSGRLEEMLESGDRVEIVVRQLAEEVEAAAVQRGAAVARTPHGVCLTADACLKRELVETLWNAGCDVISMNPVKSTLQELFLKLVGDHEAAK
jgi:ABC-2 type transport system ATP-binding protein